MKTLIISDIHGNADALQAVVDAEDAIDHTIFLGHVNRFNFNEGDPLVFLQGQYS